MTAVRSAGSTAGGPVAAAVDPASRPAGDAGATHPAALAVPVDPETGLASCLYEGTLHHARFEPVHRFRYRVLMAYLDLDELPGSLDAHPLWSARRPAPMRWRREDFHGDPSIPLDVAVRDTVERELGHRPTGPIRLLAHLRTWGWSFNPITFAFAFAPDGVTIDAVVAEVTNTPWHERHAYVMPVGATEVTAPVRFRKELHVSPFMDLDLDHAVSFTRPGARSMAVCMDDWHDDACTFTAVLRLERRPLTRAAMGAALHAHPLPAQRVSAGIYREALRLRMKRAPFRHHPAKAGPTRRTSSATPPAHPSSPRPRAELELP